MYVNFNNLNAAFGIVFLVLAVLLWSVYRRSTGLIETVKANKPKSVGDDESVEVLFKQNKTKFIGNTINTISLFL